MSAAGALGISAITLVQDRAAHLQNLIEGLRRCVPPPDELVVVNMNAGALMVSDVVFPIHIANLDAGSLPLAAARNLGAQTARREHLLFLDVDCIPQSNLPVTMNAALAANDALVCAEVLYLNKDAVNLGWTEASLAAGALAHPARTFPASGLEPESNPGLFWSLAFGIRRTSFHALGGFDTIFVGYGAEDTDFGFRAKQSGLPLYFLGGTRAYHQHHGVFDPPLQHFTDIIRNAKLFHDRWNIWPMDDWLNKFAALGLVEFTDSKLNIIRTPDQTEIEAARRQHARF